jgi:hypothetical protein
MKKLILTILATCSFGIQAERHRIFDLLGIASTYEAFKIQSDESGARIIGEISQNFSVLLYEVALGKESDIPSNIRDAVVDFNLKRMRVDLSKSAFLHGVAKYNSSRILREFGVGRQYDNTGPLGGWKFFGLGRRLDFLRLASRAQIELN